VEFRPHPLERRAKHSLRACAAYVHSANFSAEVALSVEYAAASAARIVSPPLQRGRGTPPFSSREITRLRAEMCNWFVLAVWNALPQGYHEEGRRRYLFGRSIETPALAGHTFHDHVLKFFAQILFESFFVVRVDFRIVRQDPTRENLPSAASWAAKSFCTASCRVKRSVPDVRRVMCRPHAGKGIAQHVGLCCGGFALLRKSHLRLQAPLFLHKFIALAGLQILRCIGASSRTRSTIQNSGLVGFGLRSAAPDHQRFLRLLSARRANARPSARFLAAASHA